MRILEKIFEFLPTGAFLKNHSPNLAQSSFLVHLIVVLNSSHHINVISRGQSKSSTRDLGRATYGCSVHRFSFSVYVSQPGFAKNKPIMPFLCAISIISIFNHSIIYAPFQSLFGLMYYDIILLWVSFVHVILICFTK